MAARWLERKGYEIVWRNFLCRGGELDIIARRKDMLVFVEVKTRDNTRFGSPAEAVDAKKRRRMVLAANVFLLRYGNSPPVCRFDVIEVESGRNGAEEVSHIPDAFRPGWAER